MSHLRACHMGGGSTWGGSSIPMQPGRGRASGPSTMGPSSEAHLGLGGPLVKRGGASHVWESAGGRALGGACISGVEGSRTRGIHTCCASCFLPALSSFRAPLQCICKVSLPPTAGTQGPVDLDRDVEVTSW